MGNFPAFQKFREALRKSGEFFGTPLSKFGNEALF